MTVPLHLFSSSLLKKDNAVFIPLNLATLVYPTPDKPLLFQFWHSSTNYDFGEPQLFSRPRKSISNSVRVINTLKLFNDQFKEVFRIC